jgi:hypothetical protein
MGRPLYWRRRFAPCDPSHLKKAIKLTRQGSWRGCVKKGLLGSRSFKRHVWDIQGIQSTCLVLVVEGRRRRPGAECLVSSSQSLRCFGLAGFECFGAVDFDSLTTALSNRIKTESVIYEAVVHAGLLLNSISSYAIEDLVFSLDQRLILLCSAQAVTLPVFILFKNGHHRSSCKRW